MSDLQYQDNVDRVLAVLKKSLAAKFEAYYDGDPEAIPLVNLPALIVQQTGEDTQEGAMGEDDVIDQITIKVVFNKRDDFTGSRTETINMTSRKIREIVGRRNPETGQYQKGTIKHAIRTALLDHDVEAVANTMNVEYGIRPRPSGDGFAELTEEGHVSFPIQFSVVTY